MLKTDASNIAKFFLASLRTEGVPIINDPPTGDVLVELERFAIFLGFKSAEDMMSDDEVLDFFSDQIKRTGKSPFVHSDPLLLSLL
jgi:hypothetical protein